MTQPSAAGGNLRLPASAHMSQPWRIHDLTGDFRLEDVWALPTPGGKDDFGLLMRLLTSRDGPLRTSSSRTVRILWSARKALGRFFGWDDSAGYNRAGYDSAGCDTGREMLRDRLPEDLASAGGDHDLRMAPFTTLYLLHDEWAAELVNRTMHGVIHIGWVQDGSGRYRGQLAVLVKPNGLLGAAYMAAIKPLRHLIVYPLALRQTERAWRDAARASRTGAAAGRPSGARA